jgi:O-acetylserine/cysteine efflux transporter
MRPARRDALLTLSLLFAVFLWGGSNSGTKFIVSAWPPIWTGGSRFCCAGFLMVGVLRWTGWLGSSAPIDRALRRRLWWRGGLSLAVYIVAFNCALRLTAVSHVALYLGAAPVWALLWETPQMRTLKGLQRYCAAALALAGIVVLFWPTIRTGRTYWLGEVLGLAASVLWANYGRQCRKLTAGLSGAEVSAHTMWRAGVLLLPAAVVELSLWGHTMTWRTDVLAIQAYCILFGGVAAFAIWNHALSQWPASQVLLFNNLIPLSTMIWARWCLGEPVSGTFWVAMALVVTGVVLGQANWQRMIESRVVPPE